MLSPMIDLRPVGYIIGLLVVALGAAMSAPMAADILNEDANWRAFGLAGFLTALAGGLTALGSGRSRRSGLTIQQTFLLTVLSWLVLPIFGALPFVLGAPAVTYTDAFFEAMSGLTTTGSTVFVGLDHMPHGTLLWRGLLQWFGGVGIVVVAMAFLPMLKVGGMQFFKSEAFDTFGKILPRAGEIAASISSIYVGLTALCAVAYSALGMSIFDAIVHSMTTIATGGFANYDNSMGHFPPAFEYISALFMVLASLPFVRFVQLARGSVRPLYLDTQIQGFIGFLMVMVLSMTLYRMATGGESLEQAFRQALFNLTSITTGTGYASVDYMAWGSFAVAAFFIVGLVGGCTGSTSCSIKVFRFQIVYAALVSQFRRIHSPHGIFTPRYMGRPVADEVISSVMSFFFMFVTTMVIVAVALGMMGLDTITAVSGAATALANIGPGLGDTIGPAGNFSTLSDSAKWLLAMTMLVGRLELMSVYVLFTIGFWRN
jgi:trk system potassium uptake protein TrkH